MDPQIRLLDLAGMPKSHSFNSEEIAFLKKHVNTDNWIIHYAIYTQKSSKRKYVAFVIDRMANNPRGRKPAHYSLNVICSRRLTQREKMWEYKNWGCHNRRLTVYWEHYVESVIFMDDYYNVETPQKFIDLCKSKGYTGGIQTAMKL